MSKFTNRTTPFKIGSFEEELAKGMEQKLVSRQTENQFSIDRLAKAVDFLNAASQIFDDTGFYAEAEVLTQMLEKIAADGLKKKSEKRQTSWDDLTDREKAFYDKLPPDTKRALKGSSALRADAPGLDYASFVYNIKDAFRQHLLNEQHKKQVPEVIEFNSIFPPKMPDAASAPGSDVIEFGPLSEDEIIPDSGEYELIDEDKKKV